MRRFSLGLSVLALALLLCTSGLATAQPKPEFRPGFKDLADQIPEVVGEPLEGEQVDPASGDSLQPTTTGLMVGRKADGRIAFTDGSRTWISGPYGLRERSNAERFDWEQPGPASPGGPTLTIKPDPASIAANYPAVDGSTSTHPLQMLIACKIQGVDCGWGPSPLSAERRIAPILREGPVAESIRALFLMRHFGTHESYVNLIDGKADFILVARLPSEDELSAARLAGVALEPTAVALDAFVFLLNARNPVDTLSLDQARGIYTGKIADWAELGGSPGKIKAYRRQRNSGSQELMEALVMKGTPMIDAPEMLLETMIGPINTVGTDLQGIGYSVYYYTEFMLPDPEVKIAGVGGVKPTPETIGKRTYPLTAEVYAVVRGGTPKDSPEMMLLNWLLSVEGQAVVAESGYVPIR